MHARGGCSEPKHTSFLFTVLNLPTMMRTYMLHSEKLWKNKGAILKMCKQTRGAIDPSVLNRIKESKDRKLVMHTHNHHSICQKKIAIKVISLCNQTVP